MHRFSFHIKSPTVFNCKFYSTEVILYSRSCVLSTIVTGSGEFLDNDTAIHDATYIFMILPVCSYKTFLMQPVLNPAEGKHSFFLQPCLYRGHRTRNTHTQMNRTHSQTRLITLQPHWPLYTVSISIHSCHFPTVRTGRSSRSELTADSSLSQTDTLLFTAPFHPTCDANTPKYTIYHVQGNKQCRAMPQYRRY